MEPRPELTVYCYMLLRQLGKLLLIPLATLIAVGPQATDLSRHCLNHEANPVLVQDELIPGSHGLHHTDCTWLTGRGDIRAIVVTSADTFTLFTALTFDPSDNQHPHTADLYGLHGRSPPLG